MSWTITATQVGTTTGRLVVDGVIDLHNTGGTAATIGNVAVVLQAGAPVTTVSADVADATSGDGATAVLVTPHATPQHVTTIAENAASGSLTLEDASTNAPLSLVPELQIAGGATLHLLYSAAFDNNALGLATGAHARAEVVVSFGDARPHGDSVANLDINGNGMPDADEAWVGGESKQVTFTIPAPTTTSSTPTISDDASDITTTGTVTFSSPTFSLGATDGTASVTYDPGANGGTITNCASLTGGGTTTTIDGHTFPNGDGVNATACDTETIPAPPPPCTDGTPGCPWQNGDELTYTQVTWPESSTASALITANYSSVYASSLDIFEIGVHGTGGYSLSFSDASSLLAFLPQGGTAGPLTSDHTDATSSEAGLFGGDVAALKLNIDFAHAGVIGGASSTEFGDLHLCGLTATPDLDGTTVSQLLAIANTWLGNDTGPDTLAAIDTLVANVNVAFDGGSVSAFAQAHLVNGTCP